MANLAQAGLKTRPYTGFFQKRVPTKARIFVKPIACSDATNAVAEQTAEVADLLLERR